MFQNCDTVNLKETRTLRCGHPCGGSMSNVETIEPSDDGVIAKVNGDGTYDVLFLAGVVRLTDADLNKGKPMFPFT